MSAVEEMLARIASMGGVEGYVIVDNKGVILRQSKSLSSADASTFAIEMLRLTAKARHTVRDLDPKNDLEFFRLRGKEREILAAPGPGDAFLAFVIQKWTPSASDASA